MMRLARKVEREKIVLSSLPELSVQIMDYARDHGRVTIGEIAKLTGISRNTLKEHFKSLVENGHLAIHGKTRGSWYSLR
jgi:predicted ArsR family transcriptional regulator